MIRCLSMGAFAVALAILISAANAKDQKSDESNHEGTVVSATANMLVITDNAGKEHSHTVGADVKVTIDGKDSKLTDLKKGDKVTVGTKDGKVTSVQKK